MNFLFYHDITAIHKLCAVSKLQYWNLQSVKDTLFDDFVKCIGNRISGNTALSKSVLIEVGHNRSVCGRPIFLRKGMSGRCPAKNLPGDLMCYVPDTS